MNGRKRGIAGLFLGIGSAMVALAIAGTRPAGQRALYILSGVLFIIAAIIRLRRPDSGGSA